jgi:hypothetical protein
VSLLLPWLLD